jgi:hypothetical protein
MAVFIWASGALPVAVTTDATVNIFVNNRTTTVQTGRAILWNMETVPKTEAASSEFAILPNSSLTVILTNTGAAFNLAEVEVRVSDPHMDVTFITAAPPAQLFAPGFFFRDSSETENP